MLRHGCSIDVTVAICTWNRAELLDATLTRMREVRIPDGVEWEILVVNNNCTDRTDEVIRSHAGHLPLRRLFEARQGHSNARNCAMSAARGEMLLWTDDDVLVDPDWVAAYIDARRRWPDATFFGGVVEPWFECEPPSWIKRHIQELSGIFALRCDISEDRPIPAADNPVGANMAFVTEKIRGIQYNTTLGRIGPQLTGCDETDVFDRLSRDGHHGVFIAGARVKHYVTKNRLTLKYLWRWYKGDGQTEVRRSGDGGGPYLFGVPRWTIRQFVKSYSKFVLLYFKKSEDWLNALRRSAYLSGVMTEARTRHVASRKASPSYQETGT